MEGIHAFQISTTRIYNLNSSSHPHHPSERKQACYSLFSWCARSKFLPTSQHEKLRRAVEDAFQTNDVTMATNQKATRQLGRRGFCMTTQGNLVEWSMSRPKLWVHQSLLCDGGQITITYHCSVQDALHGKFAWPPLYFWVYHWDESDLRLLAKINNVYFGLCKFVNRFMTDCGQRCKKSD